MYQNEQPMTTETFLERIIDVKKLAIERLYQTGGLQQFASPKIAPPSFSTALQKQGLSLIAEVKKASPSKGIIRTDFEPVELAKEFKKKGARAISVLTETDFFQGHPDDLRQVVSTVNIPVLRKDFIIDPIQVKETQALGASAMLLIVAILSSEQLASLTRLGQELGLDVLVEVHDEEELDVAMDLDESVIIGVNNRNLHTFETDPLWAKTLIPKIKRQQPNRICVAESGYDQQDQLALLDQIDGVLIGEGLAKNPLLLDYFNA